MIIPLRQKYLWPGRYPGHGKTKGRTNQRKRLYNKLNAKAKALLPEQPPPPTLVIVGGKKRWIK